MNYKRKLFDFNYIPINLSIIAYKVLELYNNKLDAKYKNKFNNLCDSLTYPYIK